MFSESYEGAVSVSRGGRGDKLAVVTYMVEYNVIDLVSYKMQR